MLNREQTNKLKQMHKSRLERLKNAHLVNWKKNDLELLENGYKPITRDEWLEVMRNADKKSEQDKIDTEELYCQLRVLKTLRERLLK